MKTELLSTTMNRLGDAIWPDSRAARGIERRAEELAGEGFDSVDDFAGDWLNDHRGDEDVDSLVLAAILIAGYRATEQERDALGRAVERLRERYVTDCACLYREIADQEYVEAAADDQWEER